MQKAYFLLMPFLESVYVYNKSENYITALAFVECNYFSIIHIFNILFSGEYSCNDQGSLPIRGPWKNFSIPDPKSQYKVQYNYLSNVPATLSSLHASLK